MSTLEEYFEKVNELQKEAGGKVLEDASWKQIAISLGLDPCKLHILKQGKKCRMCKQIDEAIANIGSKKDQIQNGMEYHSFYMKDPITQINTTLIENVYNWDYYKDVILKRKNIKDLVDFLNNKFDTFSGWTSSKHGIPSVFWSCVVRLFQILPTMQEIEEVFEMVHQTPPLVMIVIFIRYGFQPTKMMDFCFKRLSDKRKLNIGQETVSMKQFLIEIMTEYKYFGMILPEIDLSIARKINWKIYNLDFNVNQQTEVLT